MPIDINAKHKAKIDAAVAQMVDAVNKHLVKNGYCDISDVEIAYTVAIGTFYKHAVAKLEGKNQAIERFNRFIPELQACVWEAMK